MLRRFSARLLPRLNAGPCRAVLAGYYQKGLSLILYQLRQLPEVAAVYGCGSYFAGDCVYGRSDIDLVVVIGPEYSRLDDVQSKLARIYLRTKWVFPFIDDWSADELSVIYLSEIEQGERLPSSFVLRARQNELYLLTGDIDIEQYLHDTEDRLAVVEQVASLLRLVLSRERSYLVNGYFWQRVFRKLSGCLAALRLPSLVWEDELSFCARPSEELQRLVVNPDQLCARLVKELLRLGDDYVAGKRTVDFYGSAVETGQPAEELVPSLLKVLSAAGVRSKTRWYRAPYLITDAPTLLHFAPDQPMALVEMPADCLWEVRRLLRALDDLGRPRDCFILSFGGFLALVHREEKSHTVVPLHPLRYPLAYGEYLPERIAAISTDIWSEIAARNEGTRKSVARQYRRSANWIEKHAFPCTYREDERLSLRDAMYIWRKQVFADTGVDYQLLEDLLHYLRSRFPEAREFIDASSSWYLSESDVGECKYPPNNLYRCMHQFTAQLLAGSVRMQISPVNEALGLTVGVITRNRSTHLRQMLDSLMLQDRLPNEVLIVDNGSEDDTKESIESFQHKLPIRYHFLAEASIPKARNYVLQHASQEVICFTDDDCLTDPRWLASVERAFLRADNVGVVGGWVYHHPSEQPSALDSYYQLFHHRKP